MKGKLAYLLAELKKERHLQDKRSEAFCNSLGANRQTFVYIREVIIPGYDKDLERQHVVINNELKRLLGDKYEECNKTKELSI